MDLRDKRYLFVDVEALKRARREKHVHVLCWAAFCAVCAFLTITVSLWFVLANLVSGYMLGITAYDLLQIDLLLEDRER